MNLINWRDYIISSPDVLRGKPRIKGTRIPSSLILGYLAGGNSVDDIMKEFPDITKEHISACLDYARDLSEFEIAVRKGKLFIVEPHRIRIKQ